MQRGGWTDPPPRRGNLHPTRGSAPYNVYPCADGFVAIICVQEAHWAALLRTCGSKPMSPDSASVRKPLNIEVITINAATPMAIPTVEMIVMIVMKLSECREYAYRLAM